MSPGWKIAIWIAGMVAALLGIIVQPRDRVRMPLTWALLWMILFTIPFTADAWRARFG